VNFWDVTLLQSLPFQLLLGNVVSMDFVQGLHQSRAANAILVVVYMFTKFGHFILLRHPFTANKITSTAFTAYPQPLFFIRIVCSLVCFGGSYFNWLGLNCARVPRTILKRMARRNNSTLLGDLSPLFRSCLSYTLALLLTLGFERMRSSITGDNHIYR
jgi:hypothetical protein